MASLELTNKQKDYLFGCLINGCNQRGIDYVSSFDKDNYIKSVKLSYDGIYYTITDVIVMGCSILFKQDDSVTQLWNAPILLDFIKNNKWGD